MNWSMSFQLPWELFLRLRQYAEAKGIQPDAFIGTLLDQNLPPFDPKAEAERQERARLELQKLWAEDSAKDEDEDEDPDAIFRAIDEDRLGDRKLFPPEMKGISW